MGRKNEYTTKSRTRILECLRENADQTITVNAIQSYLEREDKSVNLTTIYRYLDKLNKEGLVMKYASNKDDTATYQIYQWNIIVRNICIYSVADVIG